MSVFAMIVEYEMLDWRKFSESIHRDPMGRTYARLVCRWCEIHDGLTSYQGKPAHCKHTPFYFRDRMGGNYRTGMDAIYQRRHQMQSQMRSNRTGALREIVPSYLAHPDSPPIGDVALFPPPTMVQHPPFGQSETTAPDGIVKTVLPFGHTAPEGEKGD